MKIGFRTEILMLLLLFSIMGCIQNTSSTLNSSHQKPKMEPSPKMAFYIDDNSDGIFEEIVPVEEPVPFIGKDEFNASLIRMIKYPPSARENGIAGFVVLEVMVDEFGFVNEVNVKKSLTYECDEEVIRAFLSATQNGYGQLKWNSTYVKYKMDFPFGFWLG